MTGRVTIQGDPTQHGDHPGGPRPLGGFLFGKVFDIRLCMFPSCSHCFTGLRTYFVFSVAQLLPMLVNFFGFNGNFNGKMTKIKKWPKITFPGSKMVPKVSKWGF